MTHSALIAGLLSSMLMLIPASLRAQTESEPPCEEIMPEQPLAPPAQELPALVPQPPPVPPGYGPVDRRREKEQRRELHRWLTENDPEYRSALRRRRVGIVLASVLGSVGAVVSLVAGIVWVTCDAFGRSSSCDDPRAWTIAGLLTMGAGLGVGIPLAVSGQRRVRAIREHTIRRSALLPRVGLSLGRGGRLALRWEF